MKNKLLSEIGAVITALFFVCALAMLFLAPVLLKMYLNATGRPFFIFKDIIIAFYCLEPVALTAFACLFLLLLNIIKETVFIRGNVRLLRIVSYCAFLASAVCFTLGYMYLPYILCGVAAAFIGLLLQVLVRVFAVAVEIKEENELTI